MTPKALTFSPGAILMRASVIGAVGDSVLNIQDSGNLNSQQNLGVRSDLEERELTGGGGIRLNSLAKTRCMSYDVSKPNRENSIGILSGLEVRRQLFTHGASMTPLQKANSPLAVNGEGVADGDLSF